MLASIPDGPLGKPGTWLFEPKLDGIRCIALIQNGVATLLSRRGLNLTSQYPGLAAEIPNCVSVESCILDGEIIALNAAGRPSFQHLQQRMNLTKQADIARAEVAVPAHFFAFDITRVGDYDLTACKLVDRKAVLAEVLSASDRIHLTPSFDCEGPLAYEVCIENGFEGIVAKRSQSPYEVGRRSPYWHKVKAQQTGEFVIGGYSPGEGSRASTFGALLLGYFDTDGKLIYCGSVGTGFDDRLLAETMRRLKPLVVPKTPFKNPPKDKKGCVWTTPNVVAEIKYMDVTRDGHLRTPVFLHFREDKVPAEITQIDPPAALPVATPETIYDKVLGQLAGEAVEMELIVGSEKIKLTSLNKELWPNVKKRDYLRCLAQMAPYLLPHWQNRPITLIRSPFGVGGRFFFQKHWHSALPEFVETLPYIDKDEGTNKEYLLCNNLASLLFFAQHGVLEFHTFASRTSLQPDPPPGCDAQTPTSELLAHPDYIIFDLDYHAKSNKEKAELDLDAFKRARDVAFALYEYLKAAKLHSYAKLSGKNGLHVFVPVRREFDFAGTRTLAETIARFLVSQRPNEVSIDFEVKKREGRVYLDCGSNGAGKTIAAAYTPRAVSWGSVSTPVTWKELESVSPLDFTLYTMATRLQSVGDIWVDILTRKNDLTAAVSKTNTK